ncbi:uncharacterized protein LOC131308066 [Rhododendron vialii]|uniref:uncharacterized protein LOC131308066 n=1 Tax=Rhododendron vialii TaxID=182163 RepID=UPI00265FF62E|nr:uncharacterized protein LOC131308066 [Rhododendron vialii]
MGLVGILKFAFKCFDLLAWPLFGLGCPLYASIQAIENNSNLKMRNLAAYWILFSLVSLFELAFVKLTEWLPFWPYLKVIAMCLLVLPDFNGASYVYECLLRPCLSVDPRTAMKYLIKPKEEKSLNAENFLAVAERYVQENGSEALEKLLDRKSKHTKPDIGVEEIKSMTNTEERDTAAATQFKYEEPDVVKVDARAGALPEKSPVAATKLSKVKEPRVAKENANVGELKDESPAAVATEQEARLATAKSNLNSPHWQVKCVEPNRAQNEKKTVAAGEIKEKTVATAGGESKAVEIIDSEKVQREWTCAKSKSASERKQGRRHKARELKASQQVNESEGSSSLFQSKHTKPDIGVEEIKEMTNTEEKEIAAATQFKYEEPNVVKVDARAVALPEKSPVAATKLSKVKEPHVAKENANAGELKDESPAVATEQEARLATAKLNINSPLWQVKCVEPNLAHNEKKTVAAGEIKKKTVATAGGESKAVEITDPEKVKRVWTCALCQVTTIGEKMLEYHLQGRRHKAQELKASKQVNESEGSSSLFQSKHTKPDIGVEEIKEMTNTEEKETAAAIQSKYEEPDVGKVDARAVELPEKSPVAATKLSNVKEPHVDKENANAGELKNESPEVATEQSKYEEPNVGKVDARAVEQPEKRPVAATKLSKYEEPNVGKVDARAVEQPEKRPVAATKLFKYEEPDVVKVDARAGALPEKSPVAATKLSKVKEPHVAKENANVGELKDESPAAVATEQEARLATAKSNLNSPHWQVKCVEPNLAQNEKKTVATGEIKEKTVAIAGGESKAVEIINSEKVQREWTCAKSKSASERKQGRRHKARELKASQQVKESEGSSSLFQSKHTKPDIGVEEIKEMTNTEEKEIAAATQFKYEEPNVVKVDARAVALPEKSPVAATKLSKVKEPHVAKENANAGELKDESPAVATEQEARLATAKLNLNSPLWQVKCVEPNLAHNEKKTVAAGEIKKKTVATAGGESKAVEITDPEKVKRVWTCALCQVTTTGEKMLEYHLQGRRHKAQELKAIKQVNESEGSSSLFQSKHTKPDIGVEEIKEMTNTEEKEIAAATQFKYEEPNVVMVDARAVALPEKSPGAATKWSKVKEPHVAKENANAGELKDESPAVATEQEAILATAKLNLNSPLWQVKCVEPNLAHNEKKTVAAGEIKKKTVATVGGESKAVEITDSEKVKRVWTCALCQVTTIGEKMLECHLQGRRHKAQELKASKHVNESEGSSSLFQSKHTKPDIGVEEIKEMTNTEEKETAAAIQSKYEEPNVGKVDARAVELPEKSPVAATKLSKVSEPHVDKENANARELKDESRSPAVATEQVNCVEPNLAQNEKKAVATTGQLKGENPAVATEQVNCVEPNLAQNEKKAVATTGQLKGENPAVATEQVKCVEPNLAQNEKKTVAAGEIKEKTVAAAGGENKAVEITDSEKVQREWACSLCLVTFPCEKNLDSHLQGRKHKAKFKKLKASKQVNKNKGSSSSAASLEPKNRTKIQEQKVLSKVILDDWKRLYSNTKTNFREVAIKGFWDMYDPEGYSLWFCDYKYNDENTVSFVTLNKVGGFLQRMDLARKFAFGKMLIIGSEPPFKVKGLWLFHGQQIPQFIIDECYDMELYDWKKVDISDEDQKERVNQMIEDQEPFEGEALLDAKCFK